MRLIGSATVVFVLAMAFAISGSAQQAQGQQSALTSDHGVRDGQRIFRFDTFGDEQLWTDALRMHEVIAAAVDPITALGVGLKVDVEALPEEIVNALRAGDPRVDLTDPATTVALLSLNAVVGVKGTVDEEG